MRFLDSDYYLNRNKALLSEIRKQVRGGLIFERQSLVPTNNKGITISSLGSFSSDILEKDVFIGLVEYGSSSARLQTVVHLEAANWYVHNFSRPTEPVSAFYGLLVDRGKRDIGMIFEDISRGGSLSVIQSERILDPTLSEEKVGKSGLEHFQLRKVTEWQTDEESKIVDFSQLIPALTYYRQAHEISLHKYGDLEKPSKIPTIIARNSMRRKR